MGIMNMLKKALTDETEIVREKETYFKMIRIKEGLFNMDIQIVTIPKSEIKHLNIQPRQLIE